MRVQSYSARVALASGLFAIGCNPSAPDEELCARLGGHELTQVELVQLRAHLRPAPPLPQTLSLAIDIRTAEYVATGTVGVLDWPETIRAYRGQIRQARERSNVEELNERFSQEQTKLGLVRLSCAAE